MIKFAKGIILCLGVVMFLGNAATGKAATESGTYPTRKGVILCTADAYKGLIPTGHAAIVWDKNSVIESVQQGVCQRENNWKITKNTVYGVTLYDTTAAQDAMAADWCAAQIGKKYNWNYFNTNTRKTFYCSQLVWAAFKDNYGIDLNTSAWLNAIHPMELVNTNRTYMIYSYQK